MSKVSFVYTDGKEYTLEYTRRTVAETERKGFVAEEIDKKPVTMIPLLWEGAFLAHHRAVPKDKLNEIWDWVKNKKSMIGALSNLYVEPVMTLLGGDDDEEEDQGNANWTLT